MPFGIIGAALELIGEFFGEIVIDKLIRPIFYYTGVGLRRLYYRKNKTLDEIKKRPGNTTYGVFFWVFIIGLTFAIRFH